MSENDIMANELEDDPNDYRVTLELEDDTTIECAIMTILDEPMEGGDVFIYRYCEDADGTPSLGNIEDDEEFEKVSDRFDEFLDEQTFDSMP